MKKLIFPILSSILLAAHFSRVDIDWLTVICLLIPFCFFIKKRWLLRAYQVYLLAGAVIWSHRTIQLANIRLDAGQPWLRMAVILGVVAFYTLISAIILEHSSIKKRYPPSSDQ